MDGHKAHLDTERRNNVLPSLRHCAGDPVTSHRATCPVCQAHERAAREQYARKPARWQTIALRPVCSPPCTPADYGGFGFCGECGKVEVWGVTK